MKPVNIHDLRRHFSRILRKVAAGDEVVISKRRVPVARLVPIERGVIRKIGIDAGAYTVPCDFDSTFATQNDALTATPMSVSMITNGDTDVPLQTP